MQILKKRTFKKTTKTLVYMFNRSASRFLAIIQEDESTAFRYPENSKRRCYLSMVRTEQMR